jgi:Zn-dependent M28 family amino/carboxypeptidase
MIPNPRIRGEKKWVEHRRNFSFEEITLAYSVVSHFSAFINPKRAHLLFEGSGVDLDDLYEMDRNNSMKSFPLTSRLSFQGNFSEREFWGRNVIGILPGGHSEKKDSYVIVTAHYDHLGMGEPVKGDSIYNGAFDNAAGVSALLEMARVFSEASRLPRRSILFLFVTGEEQGVLGSRYYIDHPIVPLYKSVAAINIDGIALFDTFNDIVGIGSELSTLGKRLEAVASELNLKVSSVPSQFLRTESFARSDQIAFAQAGIPSLLTMEGLDYRHMTRDQALEKILHWMKHVYHTPFDDLSQTMNIQAAVQHTRLLTALIWTLADHPDPPQWKSGSPFLNAQLQNQAENR